MNSERHDFGNSSNEDFNNASTDDNTLPKTESSDNQNIKTNPENAAAPEQTEEEATIARTDELIHETIAGQPQKIGHNVLTLSGLSTEEPKIKTLAKDDWSDHNNKNLCEAREAMEEMFGRRYSPIILAPDEAATNLDLELGDGDASYYELGTKELDEAIEDGNIDKISELVYGILNTINDNDKEQINTVVVGTAWATLNEEMISKIKSLGAKYVEI